MGDRDIESWDKRLADQERRGWENYLRRRINLDTAKDLDLLAITGEFIYVEDVSSAEVMASVRLNRTSNNPIDLQLATRIKTIFTQIYITHPAQAGEWIDLIWGINFDYRKEHRVTIDEGQVQASFPITNAVADENTPVESHACIAALVKAHPGNAGISWIQWTTPAIDAQCYPLSARSAVAVPVTNTDKINVLFKTSGDKVTIVFTV